MELREGTLVAERFRLVRKLGEGGMGSVWHAHHVGLGTACAVKFIHPEVASLPDVGARFQREAQAAAQLRSPHVVQVLDYGVWGGVPYLAMELLDGEDLAERLARRGRLPPGETVTVVAQIARALHKAHAAGLVHRDIKPENVFLARDDDVEIAKVLDFGIAKAMAGDLRDAATKTGAMMGTPFYMSPEQAQGMKTVDHRSDLWALAVLAYRCLVGKLPFESDVLGGLLMQIIVHPLPVPSQHAPYLPPAFDAWWARGVARDPALRFQSAKELSDALAAALGVAAQLPFSNPALSPVAGEPSATPLAPGGRRPVLELLASVPEGALRPASGAPLPPSGAVYAVAGTPAGSNPGAYAAFPGPYSGATPNTMNPAARTFHGQPSSGAGFKAALVLAALGLLAGGVGLAFWLHARAGAAAAASDAATLSAAPVASSAPPEAMPPASADAAEPARSSAATAGRATEKKAAPAASRAQPASAPPTQPAHARTGKVVLSPPPP